MEYVEPGKARFTIEADGMGEVIRIKARKQIFALLFLPVWFAGWTIGGIAAMTQLADGFDAFVALWLCIWALAWLFAATTLAWMIFGVETIRAKQGDLEIGFRIGPLVRCKLYRGTEIRDLQAVSPAFPFGAFRFSGPPFLPGPQSGAVRFSYGARSVHAARDLDEAEGQIIVDRLRKSLPATVASA